MLEILHSGGEPARLAVEFRVAEPEVLTPLQAKLTELYPDIALQPTDDLHMTLYHFGKPMEILRQIRQHNPVLSYSEFEQKLHRFLEDCFDLAPQEFALPVQGWEFLGHAARPALTLAMQVSSDHWVNAKFDQAAGLWHQFLLACGAADIEVEERGFKPHVTLGHLPAPGFLPELPLHDLPVRFGPSRLRNVIQT